MSDSDYDDESEKGEVHEIMATSQTGLPLKVVITQSSDEYDQVTGIHLEILGAVASSSSSSSSTSTKRRRTSDGVPEEKVSKCLLSSIVPQTITYLCIVGETVQVDAK